MPPAIERKDHEENLQQCVGEKPRAEENHRVTTQRYKEGLVLNSEMIDALYSLTAAKTTYTQSLVDLELAQARLAKAVGE